MGATDRSSVADLDRLLSPAQILSRPIDRIARASDASVYRLVPEVVVRPRGLDEMRALLDFTRRRGRHLTFRAAGTSRSGQAISDDILVELAGAWGRAELLEGGRRVRCEPAVIGGLLNRRLRPFGRKIGPDPASIDTAMLGGILANNASGMCCGVAQNTYHTLDSLRFLLVDGTLVDTSLPDADARLRRDWPALHADLAALRDEVRGNASLAARIREKTKTKTTTGYCIQAFLDFDAPSDILSHLMVGSEGTLGFVAEATLRTVPDRPHAATALLFFEELEAASGIVPELAARGAEALEIMDSAALRSQADKRSYPFPLDRGIAALLTEFRADDEDGLALAVAGAEETLRKARLVEAPRFDREPALREAHWRLRRGLAPSVGARRPPGTVVVSEDVAVPVARLGAGIADVQALFATHGLPETAVYGHAKDGNLHFALALDLRRADHVARLDHLVRDLVDLVVGRYGGALKAEHGSGRAMAPFVRVEWGDDAYRVMRRVKSLLDPQGVLNPGVVLTDESDSHLHHLRAMAPVSPLVDRCIECGFCEPHCPTHGLTLSARQRIAVLRELSRLEDEGTATAPLRSALRADFEHAGVATCVGDGMCATNCPVSIDTGLLMKELRAGTHGPLTRGLALWAARHFDWTARGLRWALFTARLVSALPGGRVLLGVTTGLLHRWLPTLAPHVSPTMELPRPAPRLPRLARPTGSADAKEGPRAVYFPSCLTRSLGALPSEPKSLSMANALADLAAFAQVTLSYPAGIQGLCCGLAFEGKAFLEAAAELRGRTAQALWDASREGRDPVVVDASACAASLKELAREMEAGGKALRVLDFAEWWAHDVLPSLPEVPRLDCTVIFHPTCSLIREGGQAAALAVVSAHARAVQVPVSSGCCGFAGDRGFVLPEVTAHATSAEAAEIAGLDPDVSCVLVSTNRSCELGLARATQRPWRSLVDLVHQAITRG